MAAKFKMLHLVLVTTFMIVSLFVQLGFDPAPYRNETKLIALHDRKHRQGRRVSQLWLKIKNKVINLSSFVCFPLKPAVSPN